MNSPSTQTDVVITNTAVQVRRTLVDRLTGLGIRIGGITVISFVLLIFLYLFSVIIPLFLPASMEERTTFSAPMADSEDALALVTSPQEELASEFRADGQVRYFRSDSEEPVARVSIFLPSGQRAMQFLSGPVSTGLFALRLNSGEIVVAKQRLNTTYQSRSKRTVSPVLEFPLGQDPLVLGKAGDLATLLALSRTESEIILLWKNASNQVIATIFEFQETLLGEQLRTKRELTIAATGYSISRAQLSGNHRWMIAATQTGELLLINLRGDAAGEVIDLTPGNPADDRVNVLQGLLGASSWIVGTEKGRLEQWMPVRNAEGAYQLQKIRSFRTDGAAIRKVEPEQQRKGFAVLDSDNVLAIYAPAAGREVLRQAFSAPEIQHIALTPRATALVIQRVGGGLAWWRVNNEYPEISWSALWSKVWYEGYNEPRYLWQSSAASDDFEPKYSFVPLTLGTIKAAFYAMLIAMPLAILAAIYTGYFMSRRVRNWVKPSIEFMEALPTVILGFLAGLWLAPFLESHLPGVFALFVLLPLALVAFGLFWTFLPARLRHAVPDGWLALLLIPVVLIVAWLCFYLSFPMEHYLFDGDMRVWLQDHGVDYDQRNAMVVGFAMGFAIIPTIFSISEDAVFNVPGHLIDGSHALGATAWQTLTKVVIPTASPAIFSALMIGLGRAVGETMIVLMATGNTPIMDWNVFEGMRTLAANIAVEMPEAEVDSTHYRLLFLTAFVLLLFTFALNSLAELIRYQLRKKYSSI